MAGDRRGTRRGGPSIVAPEYTAQRVRFLELLTEGNSVIDAARTARLGKSTVYAAVARGKRLARRAADKCTEEELAMREFAAAVEQAKADAKSTLVSVVYRAARLDPGLAMRVLRARYPAEWNPEVMARIAALEQDEDAATLALPGVRVRRERSA